jgi:hypothetical protein
MVTWKRERWEGNIKIDFREIVCEGGRWMELTEVCVMSLFGTSDVEHLDSAARERD